jgi:general secretion pathway protein G
VPRALAGMTFVELMVLVLIIGILVAIALPMYQRYQTRIRDTQAAEDIATIAVAIANYYPEHRAYPESLADIGMDTKPDPWGNPYQYYNVAAHGKGGARKDHALNPLNTDFDLYSMGPDGATQSQITQKSSLDDVIRASDGAFLGVAANF